MISTNDLRSGVVIEVDGVLYRIVEAQHVKPGKGSAFVRVKMRRLSDGALIDTTFRAGEKVKQAYLEPKDMQYLYNDGEFYYFMDTHTFDQVAVPAEVIGDAVKFLKEDMEVRMYYYQGSPISVELPTFVELEVVETDPGVRGDTVSGGSKPATLETGAVIQVPLFIKIGDVVKVDTRTGEYVERVRSK